MGNEKNVEKTYRIGIDITFSKEVDRNDNFTKNKKI